MSATTVTGRGPGDSNGTKNDNGSGCCGIGKKAPESPSTITTTIISMKTRAFKGC